ncbi:MAG: SprT family zinc-dependent metalloprotease [Aggregatilineales bacterium]
MKPAGQHQFQYGDTKIDYELAYDVRDTMEISVHPDLSVTVIAPNDTEPDAIQTKLQKRAGWIVKQQREFRQYLPHMPKRQYVSGETHWYLGRQYRLKVAEAERAQVKLIRGYFYIYVKNSDDSTKVEQLLKKWYRNRAKFVFQERLDAILPRFASLDMPEPQLVIREMQSRWGSCSDAGKITLNLKLIQVGKPYIDYVIVHELCHLVEHNHGKRFYLLLDRIMPDWKERRKTLNEFAS